MFTRLTQPALEDALDEQAGKLVILDEVQTMPGLFATLRGQIDAHRRKSLRTGQFLLLGSASNLLLQQSAESLAARVRYLELGPLLLEEVGSKALRPLWLRGSFPYSFQAASDRTSLAWRQDFLRINLECDIPLLGPWIPAATLRRFWTMLARSDAACCTQQVWQGGSAPRARPSRAILICWSI